MRKTYIEKNCEKSIEQLERLIKARPDTEEKCRQSIEKLEETIKELHAPEGFLKCLEQVSNGLSSRVGSIVGILLVIGFLHKVNPTLFLVFCILAMISSAYRIVEVQDLVRCGLSSDWINSDEVFSKRDATVCTLIVAVLVLGCAFFAKTYVFSDNAMLGAAFTICFSNLVVLILLHFIASIEIDALKSFIARGLAS